MGEQGISTVFLRTSWGVVRNAGQLHFVPWRQIPWAEPGPCLLTHFLGDTELEGLEASLVNSNSEDVKRVGRGSY